MAQKAHTKGCCMGLEWLNHYPHLEEPHSLQCWPLHSPNQIGWPRHQVDGFRNLPTTFKGSKGGYGGRVAVSTLSIPGQPKASGQVTQSLTPKP